MATWASLTPAQQAQVQQYVDQVLRPVVRELARSMLHTSVEVIPQYLVSPTGLASTIGSPAADSVAGILATLAAGEVVPILNSGFPLSGPLLASKLVTYSSALNTALATYWTATAQQDYAQIVGAPNLVN
jgi:hypothetical protein